MAGNKTISNSQLHDGVEIKVTGVTIYSRVGSIITGDELKAADERRVHEGRIAIGRDHTAIAIRDVSIIPASGDPNNLTVEEKYVQERFYKRTNDPNGPLCYSITNKGTRLPLVIQSLDGKTGTKVDLEGKELATNLKVTLVLRVYASKLFQSNKGIGLNTVIVHEPVRFYGGTNAISAAMAAMGLTLTDGVITPNDSNVTNEPANDVSDPAPGNAFNSQVPPIRPEEPWRCPSCGATVDADKNFCGICGTKRDPNAPQPTVGNPYANKATMDNVQKEQQAAGIRYNPNSPDRNY